MTLRILHVVGGMNRAGIETWLMQVAKHIDRRKFQMDFLVHTLSQGAYDDELRTLGCRLIPCLTPSRPWRYAHNFKRILRENGPYDVVHSHVHGFSGLVLKLAHDYRVPVRIAHSHSDTRAFAARASLTRRGYIRVCHYWIRRSATSQVACSREAGLSLFGSDWREGPRRQILHCGVDLEPFSVPVESAVVRAELGIPANALVLGHVGRLEQPKNHSFLVKVISEVIRHQPRAVLLLVGDGPLRPQVQRQVNALGLRDRVIFAGVRADVPRLMRGAMDVFVFPSLYEGLGLVLVEAQAAGLPCVTSDVIPSEADLYRPLIHRLSLQRSSSDWAAAVLGCRRSDAHRMQSLRVIENSSFNIHNSVRALEAVWSESVAVSRDTA